MQTAVLSFTAGFMILLARSAAIDNAPGHVDAAENRAVCGGLREVPKQIKQSTEKSGFDRPCPTDVERQSARPVLLGRFYEERVVVLQFNFAG